MSEGLAVVSSLNQGSLAELLSSSGAGEMYNSALELEEILSNLHCDPDKLKTLQNAANIVFQESFNAKIVYGSLADYLEHMHDKNQHK